MAEDSQMFHEPLEMLRPKTLDVHRAVVSVVEELRAIDWYAQRLDATEADRLEGLFSGIYRSSVVRGGDFLIVVGGDLTLGYRFHDDRAVHLFCVETVGAHVLTPNAVCGLGAASVGRAAEAAPDRAAG